MKTNRRYQIRRYQVGTLSSVSNPQIDGNDIYGIKLVNYRRYHHKKSTASKSLVPTIEIIGTVNLNRRYRQFKSLVPSMPKNIT